MTSREEGDPAGPGSGPAPANLTRSPAEFLPGTLEDLRRIAGLELPEAMSQDELHAWDAEHGVFEGIKTALANARGIVRLGDPENDAVTTWFAASRSWFEDSRSEASRSGYVTRIEAQRKTPGHFFDYHYLLQFGGNVGIIAASRLGDGEDSKMDYLESAGGSFIDGDPIIAGIVAKEAAADLAAALEARSKVQESMRAVAKTLGERVGGIVFTAAMTEGLVPFGHQKF